MRDRTQIFHEYAPLREWKVGGYIEKKTKKVLPTKFTCVVVGVSKFIYHRYRK